MHITGLGIIGPFGRGKENLISAIESSENIEEYKVADELIREKAISHKIRRADRFTKMSIITAYDALNDAGALDEESNTDLSRTGIILATAFGPHNTTFSFLDEIIDYGDDNVSAIKFSHSVHNAAASYISLLFNITGPTITLTQFKFPVQHAFDLASCWLSDGICDNVLICCVDERGSVFDYVAEQKLNISPIKPLEFSNNASCTPSEGCAAFLVAKETDYSYCKVADKETDPDLYIIGTDGIPADESGYSKYAENDLVTAYSQIYGSMVIGTAFDCALGAMSLKMGGLYPAPTVGPEQDKLNSICCVKLDCKGEEKVISLCKE